MNVLQQDEELYLLIESQVAGMVEISQSIFLGFCLIYLVYLAYFKADKEEFDLGAALIGIAVLSLLILTYKWWTDEIGVYFVNIAKEIDQGQGSDIYKLIGSALDKIGENRRLRLSRVSGALSLLAGDFTLLEYTQWLFLSGGLLIVKAATIIFDVNNLRNGKLHTQVRLRKGNLRQMANA